MSTPPQTPERTKNPFAPALDPPPPPPARDPNVKTFLYGLSPGVDAEVTLRGAFTIEDLELLRDYIELQERGLRRSLERERARTVETATSRTPFRMNASESGVAVFDRHDDDPT